MRIPNRKRPRALVFLALFGAALAAFVGAGRARADDPLPTAAEVDQRIEALASNAGLDEAGRAAAAEVLREARRLLEEEQGYRRRVAELEARRMAAPQELVRLQTELARPTPTVAPSVEATTPTAEIERQLQAAKALETERTQALESLRGEPVERAARLKALPGALAEARSRVVELERGVDPVAGEAPALTDARRMRRVVRRAAARGLVAALEVEQQALEAESGLLAARIQAAERDRDTAQATARAWQALWQQRREADSRQAENEAARARREAENAHPEVRVLAERNVEVTRTTRELTERAKQAAEAQQAAQDELRGIERRESEVRKRIAAVGLTEAIGYLLRQHRTRLPRAADRQARLEARRTEIAELQLQRFELEDELADLRRSGRTGASESGGADGDGPPRGPDVPRRLRELTADRIGYLEAAVAENEKCVSALVGLDTTERELLARATSYAAFIDERVLWIRSTEPLWVRGLASAPAAISWVAAPAAWQGSGAAASRYVLRRGVRSVLLLLLFAGIVLGGARLGRRARSPALLAAKARRLGPTLVQLLADVLAALPLPAALMLVGTVLVESGPSEAPRALGAGLLDAAAFSLPLLLLRRILAPAGLGEAHLGWPAAMTRLVRRPLTWVLVAGTPATLVVTLYGRALQEEYNASIGRLALVLLLLVSAVFLERVLRPSRGLLTPAAVGQRTTLLQRLRGVWYVVGVATPVVLGALALFGYQFTAVELTDRLEQTVMLVTSLVLVRALVGRSLVIAHRRSTLRTATATAGAGDEVTGAAPGPVPGLTAHAATETPTSPAVSVPPAAPVEEHIDAATIDAHSRQLLNTLVVIAALLGAWFIWVDVLPALGMLREIELWTTTGDVVRDVVVDGVTTRSIALEVVPITLADILLALVVLVLTVLAARNIPGVLEVLVLERVVVQASSRYAIATVARHLIWIFGLALILTRLGFGWSKVQWLVAALGVGLGFGLQEIFGNFVSGLILLFERRIRLGDIVTVGDVSGQVTRIRVLATTVRNWERKEFIVPNKDLVTGRLLNWTLSDEVSRVVVVAGVAYGTDTRRARELMLGVARRQREVLKDPEPIATFESFGDNSLLLKLRCFISDIERRLHITTELHEAVSQAFAKAGIEIAFPQRDLHLRSVPPGWDAAPPAPPAPEA